jgi:hypothetical protein
VVTIKNFTLLIVATLSTFGASVASQWAWGKPCGDAEEGGVHAVLRSGLETKSTTVVALIRSGKMRGAGYQRQIYLIRGEGRRGWSGDQASCRTCVDA